MSSNFINTLYLLNTNFQDSSWAGRLSLSWPQTPEDIEINPYWLSDTGNISWEWCKSDKQTSAQHEFVYRMYKSRGKYFLYLKVNVV